MAFSTPGIICRKCLACSSVQNPITRSTPADAGTVVPAAVEDHDLPSRGQMWNVALGVHLRLPSLGWCGSATTRKMRGLTGSVIALIEPPLPAPVRPSKRMQTLRPFCTTHCWSLTNSTCKRASSCSIPFVSAYRQLPTRHSWHRYSWHRSSDPPVASAFIFSRVPGIVLTCPTSS
jgi:hypothetical protein